MGNHKSFLVLICFVAFISLGLPDGLIGVAWPSLRVDYGVSLDSLGGLLISFTAGYLFASFNTGYIMSKMQLGTLLAFSCLVTGASLLGYAYSGVWVVLLAMAFFLGAGGGAIDASINTFAASNFSTSVVNWLHAFYGIGATLGPVIMTFYLVRDSSWALGYTTVAIVQLVLAFIFFLTLKWWKGANNKEEEVVAPAKPRETLSLTSTWLSILLFFVYTGTEISVGQWIFTILTKSRMLPDATAGFWTSVYWGSLTVGRIVFGFIMVRFSVHKVLTACLIGVVVGACLFAFNYSEFIVLAGIVIIGFTVAPVFPSLIAMTPDRIGDRHAGNAVGYQVSAAMIGGALLPGFAGLMIDYFGVEVISKIHIIEAAIILLIYWTISRLYPVPDKREKAPVLSSSSEPEI
ncbi:sugar MFS transporter [Telluribacter sp. SYSU D00476]|uniref:MFS transporter n=1 Tax=Telluribacter sp. SYSU D00476 TaxID=2811430 RepID=UPI001FF572C4|nr:MFS transporter [Telluribacter sp. SYSU D00476]